MSRDLDIGITLSQPRTSGAEDAISMNGRRLHISHTMSLTNSGELLMCGPGIHKIPGFGDMPREFNVTLLS